VDDPLDIVSKDWMKRGFLIQRSIAPLNTQPKRRPLGVAGIRLDRI
jgi:hypothetical protein